MLVFQKKQGSGAGLSIAGATFQTQHDLGSSHKMHGFVFKPDGTKMWILNGTAHAVEQFTLSTPWDMSTASYNSVDMSITGQLDDEMGIDIKADDGTRIFVTGRDGSNPEIHQYNMSSGWDLSTASHTTFNTIGSVNYPTSVHFNQDGTQYFMSNDLLGRASNGYTLTPPWNDLNSSVFASGNYSPAGSRIGVMRLDSTGTKLFMGMTDADNITQHTLSTAWDVTSASADGVVLDLTPQSIFVIGDMRFSTDSSTLFVSRDGQQYIWEYSL